MPFKNMTIKFNPNLTNLENSKTQKSCALHVTRECWQDLDAWMFLYFFVCGEGVAGMMCSLVNQCVIVD